MASSLEPEDSPITEEHPTYAPDTTSPSMRGEEEGAERSNNDGEEEEEEEVSYDEVVYGMESFQAIYRPGTFVVSLLH